jgi:virulence-associated protein VapD
MASSRKLITFDLDTKEFEKKYPKGKIATVYASIKLHFIANGFEWRQGSRYISIDNASPAQTKAILRKLSKREPALQYCMRDCVIANISREYNATNIFGVSAVE